MAILLAAGSIHSYVAYNLVLSSDIPLPELQPHDGAAEVFVRRGKIENSGWPAGRPGEVDCVDTGPDRTVLHGEGVGIFEIVRDNQLRYDPAPMVEDQVLRLHILGPALSILLRYRGLLVLHASAVEIGGGAALFLGESGDGKSTIARALHARGHCVITDDVAAVKVDKDRHIVYPGFPQLKLWPEIATFHGDDIVTLPRIMNGHEKRARRLDSGFSQRPLPLKRIYVLARAPVSEIAPLSQSDGFIELIRHSYGSETLHEIRTSEHFRQCCNIADTVRISRLAVHRQLDELPKLAKMVERDCRSVFT